MPAVTYPRSERPPFGIYVHVPFCSKRCPYCAFVLIESDGSLHGRFTEVVRRQIRETPPVDASTFFFGGGTPSMLDPEAVGAILGAADHFRWTPNREVTMEANPEGLGLERLKAYREAGVNRLSLGVQSLDPSALKSLGRTHEPREALEAYHAARAAGFRNIAVDLIYGWPGQTPEGWIAELRRWIREGAEHFSIYGLTVEGGTALERSVKSGLSLPDERLQRELYLAAYDLLSAEGYRPYELSNYGRPGFESVHNRGYWDGRPYLGFGPGAHSYEPPTRRANLSNVRLYIERGEGGGSVVQMEEALTPEQRMLERIFLGLRRMEGLFVPDFDAEFGVDFRARHRRPLEEMEGAGLVRWSGGFLALTREGRVMADSVVGRFA